MKPGLAVGIALTAIFVMFVTAALLASTSGGSTKPSLAEKIDAACTRPGYRVTDWAVSSEYNPMPADIVSVTCLNPKTDDVYTTAVQR